MRKPWNTGSFVPSHSTDDSAVQTSTATKKMEPLLIDAGGMVTQVKDTKNYVYMMFMLFGFGALLPWNMFLNISHDYFTMHKLRGANVTAATWHSNTFQNSMTVSAQIPNLVFSFASIFLAAKGDLTRRMRVCLAVVQTMVIATIIFIYVDTTTWVSTFYYLTLLTIFILNAANGLFQNSLFGLASSFPFEYTNAILIGQNFCGIVVSVLALLTKWVTDDVNSRAFLYFGLSSIAIISCFVLLNVIKKMTFFKKYDLVEANAYEDFNKEITTWEDVRIVFSRSKMQFANIFFLFFVTLALFPNVCMYVSDVPPGGVSNFYVTEAYFRDVTTFLNFNLFAFLGSWAANHVRVFGPKTIWIPIALRVWFLIYFPSANYYPFEDGTHVRSYGPWFESTWMFVFNVTLLAFSSGYLSSLVMMYAPKAHEEPRIQRMTGMIAAFFLILGIVAGLSFSWVIKAIVIEELPIPIGGVIDKALETTTTALTTLAPTTVARIINPIGAAGAVIP